MSKKRQCGICGKSGHNARTCTSTKDRKVGVEMVEIINECMKNRIDCHPTLAIATKGQLSLQEAPHISGLLALSFCRVYLNLPGRDCPGPPPGTLGVGGVVIGAE